MLAVQNGRSPTPAHNLQLAVEGKCICQACSCGRHKCPKPMQIGQYHSSYGDEFKKPENSQIDRPTRYDMIHKNFVLPTDKFSGESAYQDTFQNKNVNYNDLKAKMPDKKNNQEKYNFEGRSSYLDDFSGKNGVRAQKQIVPNNLKVGEGKFEGESLYNNTYLNKPPIKNDRMPQIQNEILPTGQFQGDSTYHGTYLPGSSERLQQIKPDGQLKVGGKFQGNSSYLNDYINKGQPQRAEKAPLPQNIIMPKGNFNGDSTYHGSYLSNGPMSKNQQIRPKQQLKVGGKFQGQSNYTDNYLNQGKPIRAEKMPLPQNKIMPEGIFDGNSIYQGSYLPSHGEKNLQIRPQNNLKVSDEKFGGHSSYNDNYMNQGSPPRAQRTPLPQNQVLPKGKFQGDSTYHGSYVPGKPNRSSQIRPEGQLKVGEGNFNGNSSYNDNYKHSPIKKEKCPCEELNAPNYQRTNQDHLRYNSKQHSWS